MRKIGLPVVLLCGVAIGCSGSGGKGEDAARELAQAVCDLAFGCCSRGEVDFFLGPYVTDQENCNERLVNSATIADGIGLNLGAFAGIQIQLPNLAELRRAIKDGRTRVDGDALEACLAFLDGLGCNSTEEEEEPPEGCVPPEPPEETPCQSELLFVGKVGDGGACSSPGQSFECKPGLVCRAFSALGAEGACVEPGELGDLCFDDSECLDELYCSQLDGTCQEPKAQGEPCRFADPDDPAPPPSTLLIECEEELSCDPVTDTCVAPCERGSRCFSDSQCDETQDLSCIAGRCDVPRAAGLPCEEEGDCEEGLRCDTNPADPGELICQEKLANGEPCSTFGGGDECASGFCDPQTAQCAAAVEPGELCPSQSDDQCDSGYCEDELIGCSTDDQCPGSGTCNQTLGRCEFYCVAARSDGAMCERSAQCESEACVNGFCRTLPLADGEPCTSNAQCESGFCGGDFSNRECKSLPLQNGEVCSSSTQCASGICFEGLCDGGLGEGDLCDQFGQPPCGRDLYCDEDVDPPECTTVREPGELCQLADECRGACVERFGRQLCDATPTEGAAVCDGG